MGALGRGRDQQRLLLCGNWNRRDYAVFDELLAPNWVYYGYSAAPAGTGGLEEQLGFFSPRFLTIT